MSSFFSFFAANYYSFLETLAAVVAVLILISAADDLFIDLWYWGRRIVRRFTVERDYRPLTVAQLREHGEQPLAIMVPGLEAKTRFGSIALNTCKPYAAIGLLPLIRCAPSSSIAPAPSRTVTGRRSSLTFEQMTPAPRWAL